MGRDPKTMGVIRSVLCFLGLDTIQFAETALTQEWIGYSREGGL